MPIKLSNLGNTWPTSTSIYMCVCVWNHFTPKVFFFPNPSQKPLPHLLHSYHILFDCWLDCRIANGCQTFFLTDDLCSLMKCSSAQMISTWRGGNWDFIGTFFEVNHNMNSFSVIILGWWEKSGKISDIMKRIENIHFNYLKKTNY